MKYSNSIEIGLPREKVIELFDSTENLYDWMPGLQTFEHLSGEPGKEGAKSKLIFKRGNRKTEMVETITKRNLPREFHGNYEAGGVLNVQENYFDDAGENKTRWTSENEFRFSSLGLKLMGWLMPGAFKKQSLKYMKSFKKFAEAKAQSHS